MKKITILSLLLVGIAVIAFITKPSDYECRQTAVENKMQKYDAILFEGLARKLVNKGIIIEDKVFCKQIKFYFDGHSQTLGWAAFGQVFISE
jgi:hypothetical protein